MRSASERVEAMHERARLLRRARDKTINSVLGGAGAVLLAGIVILTAMLGGMLHPIDNTGEVGSSLLFEGAGGYVLVGVVSFMAAVVITVVCIRRNYRDKIGPNGEAPDNETEGPTKDSI